MKTSILTIAIFLLAVNLYAQVKDISGRQGFRKNDWEISTSFAIGLSASNYNSSLSYYSGEGEEAFYTELSLLVGYFIADGLSIEPELDYNFLCDDAALSLLVNASYTFSIPPGNSYPYLRIGYGKSGYSTSNYYSSQSTGGLFGSMNANVISAAAGLKIIQSSEFAIRWELNYKIITFSDTGIGYYGESYETKVRTSVLSLGFNASFLL